jgi:hypothetical protein
MAASLARERAGVDPLAEVLLPVLLHRLNNATQLLSGLRSLLSIEPDGSLVADRWSDLGDAAIETRRLSWALAVLASAAGSHLCLERRERSGLAILSELVRDALRRAGKDLPSVELPALAPHAPPGGEGWELAWTLASVLLLAARETERGAFAFAFEDTARGGELRVRCSEGAAMRVLERGVVERLPGAEIARARDGLVLRLPPGWLVFATAERAGGGAL